MADSVFRCWDCADGNCDDCLSADCACECVYDTLDEDDYEGRPIETVELPGISR